MREYGKMSRAGSGSKEGTMCCVTNNLIKNMEGAKWCMSRRREACSVYNQSLRNMLAYGTYSAHRG
ncbi:MAG: hypothetical protein ACM3MB_11805 [Acidobacteriota bacterium]